MKIDGFEVKLEGIYDGYEVYFIDEYVTVGPVCYLVKDSKIKTCTGEEFFKILRYFNDLNPEDDEEEIEYEDEQTQ